MLMIFIFLLVSVLLIVLVKFLLWFRPGRALKIGDSNIVKILTAIQGVLDIVFPALISVFLYLHLQNGVLYIEAAEAVIGIIICAAISVINIVLAITGGKTNGGTQV
jgi:hypothetical protein